MTTSCKPATTLSWPTNLSNIGLTVESALMCPTDELRGSWKWQDNSMNSEGLKKRSSGYLERKTWVLQQLATNLFLKDWRGGAPSWTATPSEAMSWLDPAIPANAIKSWPEIFGDPEAFRLVFMTFPRTSQ
jgi:hypothetical protein